MSYEIAAWNASGALSESNIPDFQRGERMLVSAVGKLSSANDIYVSDAFTSARDPQASNAAIDTISRVGDMYGYTALITPYLEPHGDDSKTDTQERHAVLFTRSPENASVIRIGDRNTFKFTVSDTENNAIETVCAHLHHKLESRKENEARAVLAELESHPVATILGNLNDMNHSTLVSRIFRTRAVVYASDMVVSASMRARLMRRNTMAHGRIMRVMTGEGFDDADSRSRSTTHFGIIPVGQLDHVLTRGVVVESLRRIPIKRAAHLALLARVRVETN